MVKRVILGRSGEERVVDLIKEINERATQGSTRPAGNKWLEDYEDFYWGRNDGTSTSMREVDEGLALAEVRIEDAVADLNETQIRLDDAEVLVGEVQDDLTRVETEVIPGAVADLEAADQAAAQELATLDGKLVSAQEDLTTAKGNITQLGEDLAAESDARQQLASDTQTSFTELDTRLDGFATDEALGSIRDALTAAQDAVDAAQQIATEANTAANAASQAALEAAGIAASKGRVIVSETEPTGGDRKSSNIWIKPVPDDPDTEVEEKAVTYVYLEATDEWQPTTSSELAQAAQNALDAREAAQQAQQRADTAIANAAAAQSAAEDAQRTADQATLDARDAHNEAVSAQEAAEGIRADMAAGESLWPDPSFERGWGGLANLDPYAGRIDRSQEWAASGSWSVKFTANGASINNYGKYQYMPAIAGHWYLLTATVHAPTHEQQWNISLATLGADGTHEKWLISGSEGQLTPQAGETLSKTWIVQATETAKQLRFWAGQTTEYNSPAHTGQVIYLDDFRMVDVTDSYPQYLEAKQAAQTAQERADEAYEEAESKATPADVQAAADAAESAAKEAASLDATAKAAQAKADALTEAAVTAQEKADAAKAQAVADAAQDAAQKAAQALQDALDALAAARDEISDEIVASANGKNSITISYYEPSGSAIWGDTWWRVDANDQIFGQWVYSTNNEWVPRTIRSEVIANLDVHKLQVTGDAKMQSAVIDKLWVDGIVGKAAAFNQIAVASGNILVDPQGLDPALRSNVGGASWSWDNAGKYWKRPAVQGGMTQFNAYTNVGSVYDSNLLDPGAMYVISYEVWVDTVAADTAARASIYYRRRDGTTSFVGDAIEEGGDSEHWQTPIVAGQWNKITRHWRAPDDVLSGGFNFQLLRGGSDSTEVRIRNPFVGKQAASVMIEDGAVNAQKVNAESVAGAVGQFLEIEAGQITAGEAAIDEAVIDKLWVDGLVGKTATLQSLTVATGNLVPNGSGGLGNNSSWPEFDYIAGAPPETGAQGGFRPKSTSGAWRQVAYDQPIPVKPGDKYATSIWIHCEDAGSDTAIAYDFLDVDGVYFSRSYVLWPKGMPAGLSYHESSFTVPDGAVALRFQFVTNHSNGESTVQTLYGFNVTKMVGAVLIEDGAITTPKLTVTEDMSAAIVNAMSVNTKKLVVSEEAILNHATLIGKTVVDDINVQGKIIGTDGVFTGTVDFANVNVTGTQIVNKLGANSIEANMIKGGDFTGKTFSGGTFTGGQFRAENKTSGTSVVVTPTGGDGIAGLAFTSDSGYARGPLIVPMKAGSTPGSSKGGIRITSGIPTLSASSMSELSMNTERLDLKIRTGGTSTTTGWLANDGGALTYRRSDNAVMGAYRGEVGFNIGSKAIGGVRRLGAPIEIGPALSAAASVIADLDGVFVGTGTSGTATLSGGGAEIRLRNDGSPQFVSKAVYDRTYSSSANVYVTSYGTLGRTTSSRRYKKNIADWNPEAERVLALRPRQWQHDDPEHNPEIDETWQVGFIAEEVHDIGLRGLVDYAGDGAGGWRPESLRYDRFAAAHQIVLKKHEDEIKELRERIALLEAQTGTP